MSESVEFDLGRYNSDLLNVPKDLLLQIAPHVGGSQQNLHDYRNRFKLFNGLQQRIAFGVGEIKGKYKGYGKEGEAAQTSFVSGALMTFELLRRVALKTKQRIPDPPFYSDLPVDIDPHTSMPDEPWVIDYCDREDLLPKRYPAFFEASLVMLGNTTDNDHQGLRKMLYMHAAPDSLTRQAFYMCNYLSGVMEVLVHLERHAWIEKTKSLFTDEELKVIGELVSKLPQQ